jgi:hypothetical protein
MKKFLLTIVLLVSGYTSSHALVINEIMSNPVGDDGGREWVELYNNSSSSVDISSLTISIKGGAFVPATPLSGGTTIAPDGYAIIASTVSGATKFLQDYVSYSGPLFKSTLSLVNTGVTSIEVKVGGISVDSIPSYTAAKEGLTYSRINGSFVAGTPTPGAENQPAPEDTSSNSSSSGTTTTQATIAQASAPTADIVLYMPLEKVVVAGAESTFSVFGLTHAGKTLDNLTYTWAFGDGGQGTGSTTQYRYAYTGRYIASVEGTNGYVLGTGRMTVRVVAPDIFIAGIGSGKYGSYVDIRNPNSYDLDLSQWRLVIDGASFPFPKNTFLASNSTTHFSGLAMGFTKMPISSSSVIKIVFPNQEEVTSYTALDNNTPVIASSSPIVATSTKSTVKIKPQIMNIPFANIATKSVLQEKASSSIQLQKGDTKTQNKDTRFVSFFKTLFHR